MKITIDNVQEKKFPCLMKNNVGQILLVRKTNGFLDLNPLYIRTIIANSDDCFSDVGTSTEKEGIYDLDFLPKGYKVLIEN